MLGRDKDSPTKESGVKSVSQWLVIGGSTGKYSSALELGYQLVPTKNSC